MTPFESAGYTKDTKFKVLVAYGELKKGDIVTLDYDDGTVWPYFKTQDNRICEMDLPGYGNYPELEVILEE